MWIVIGLLVLYVVWLILYVKGISTNLVEKKMIYRDNDFYLYPELFTIRHLNAMELKESVESIDWAYYGVRPKVSGKTSLIIIEFLTFKAHLIRIQSSEQVDDYQFAFVEWQETGSKVNNSNEMNIVLTAFERMFLELDQETMVRIDKKSNRDNVNVNTVKSIISENMWVQFTILAVVLGLYAGLVSGVLILGIVVFIIVFAGSAWLVRQFLDKSDQPFRYMAHRIAENRAEKMGFKRKDAVLDNDGNEKLKDRFI